MAKEGKGVCLSFFANKGEKMKHLVLIKNDLFGISKRIRQINKKLFVFLNKKTKTYQIYSKKGENFLFEKDLGSFLNQKAIVFVLENKIENMKTILDNMDRQNEKKEKAEKEKQIEFAKDVLTDFINFADKKTEDVDFSKIKIGGRNDS